VGKALEHAYVLLINVRQVHACSLAQLLQGLCCVCVCVCGVFSLLPHAPLEGPAHGM
jgi:hypothetical protein